MLALDDRDIAGLGHRGRTHRDTRHSISAQVLLEEGERAGCWLNGAEPRFRHPPRQVDRGQTDVRAEIEHALNRAQQREVDAVSAAAQHLEQGDVVRAHAQRGDIADIDLDDAHAPHWQSVTGPRPESGLEMQPRIDSRQNPSITPRGATANQPHLTGDGLEHPRRYPSCVLAEAQD